MPKSIPLLFASLALPALLHAADPVSAPVVNPEEKWAADIARFAASDRESPPPARPILFIGSSSIRMWKLEKSWPDQPVLNRGFGGSYLSDSVHFFDRFVVPYKPSAIVLYAGDNDIARKVADAEGVFASYREFVSLVDRHLPGTPVIYIAIKPSIKRWSLWPTMKDANDRIERFTRERPGLFFADIATPMLAGREEGQAPAKDWFLADGLHMSASGYARWKEVIDPLLTRAGARRDSPSEVQLQPVPVNLQP